MIQKTRLTELEFARLYSIPKEKRIGDLSDFRLPVSVIHELYKKYKRTGKFPTRNKTIMPNHLLTRPSASR
jgi:hypothetical protein